MRLFAAIAVVLVLGLFQGQFALALPHHVGMHKSNNAHHVQVAQVNKSGPSNSELDLKISGDANCPSQSNESSDCCGYACSPGAAFVAALQSLPEMRAEPVWHPGLRFLASVRLYKVKRPPRS